MFRFELVRKTFIREIWSYSDPFEPIVRSSALMVHRGNTESSNMQFGPNCAEEMNRLDVGERGVNTYTLTLKNIDWIDSVVRICTRCLVICYASYGFAW